MYITIWGKKNQCVSHLRVCCHLEHLLLLLPVSAWRLPCCSVPARGSLWSSSIKTSSPAKFITAKGCDGYEPTHQLWLHVQVSCELQVNSHNMGRETVPDLRSLFTTLSSAIWTGHHHSQVCLTMSAPPLPCCFGMELWPRSGWVRNMMDFREIASNQPWTFKGAKILKAYLFCKQKGQDHKGKGCIFPLLLTLSFLHCFP